MNDFNIVAILTGITLLGFFGLVFLDKSTVEVLPILTTMIGYLIGRKAPQIASGIGSIFVRK